MKNFTNSARVLLSKHGIQDAPYYKYDFVDIEAVLHFFKDNLPPPVKPQNTPLVDSDTDIKMIPKKTCIIRPYQKRVIQQVIRQSTIVPTLLVMPCGSGKTLTALSILSIVRRKSLIITNYKVVANQWKKELLKNFDVDVSRVQSISDESFEFNLNDIPDFTIVTYDTLASIYSESSRSTVRKILSANFKVIILDEAHKAVATNYFAFLIRLSGTFIAVTATPVREDGDIFLLKQFISSQVYVYSKELIDSGYLSNVVCKTISIPTHSKLRCVSLSHREKMIAVILNPNKIYYMNMLLKIYMKRNDKVMVFCDNVFCLKYLAKQIRTKFDAVYGPIYMETSISDREKCVSSFVDETKGSIIIVSRTGDEGLDVPCANKLIQMSTPWGSRRQHAQRVGRVQRMTASKETMSECITLVSKDTYEDEFSTYRDEYLKEMKYELKSIKKKVEYFKKTRNKYKQILSLVKNESKIIEQANTKQITGIKKKSNYSAMSKLKKKIK
jgi:DNA excision repair protein ERCC-3